MSALSNVVLPDPVPPETRILRRERNNRSASFFQPTRDSIFPARRQAGGITTAAAIHNLEADAQVVLCQLMKEGAVLEEVEIPLEGNGQDARFIEEVFTRTDTSDFVGSVRCTAPEGGLLTGVAVELDAANRIFTTLPVVPVAERMSR